MNERQPNSAGRTWNTIALVLGTGAFFVAGLTLTLDKSLPYRISPDFCVRYLWVGRLTVVSLAISLGTILFCIASRRWLPLVLSVVSLASVVLFIGGAHSGPNPEAWCFINLRNIEAAKQQGAEEIGLTNGTVVPTEQISKHIKGGFSSLKCAEGGQYVIGAVGIEPRCSFHGSASAMEARWKEESLKYLGQT